MELLFLLVLLLFEGESLSQDPSQMKIHIQEKKVTVQEGLCVSIPCSFNFSQYQNKNKTYGYWFQRKDKDKLVATNDCQKEIHSEAQGRFHLSGDLQKDNCSLSISGIQKWDGGKYWFQGFVSQDLSSSKLLFAPKAQDHGTNLTCRVTFPETKGTTETTVQLRVACTLRILDSNCLWKGERLLCTCSVQGEPAISLYWWVGKRTVDGNCSDSTLHVEYKIFETWTNSTLILAEKPDTWNFLEWIIKGALCGVIITAVLFTCLTVCLVRMLKKKISKKDSESAASGTRIKHVSAVSSVTELKEDQVQYASISFQTKKFQKTPKAKDNHAEYSELKFQ
ncbi:sialic acid-binding Ig-like lectin 12 [Macrotis lagotis]|uniref:sialic acid-binding Ig-like lectin 12 n=1 Tax=Macrotis lagotis TaxID=92651 RepID=UPI003D691AAA